MSRDPLYVLEAARGAEVAVVVGAGSRDFCRNLDPGTYTVEVKAERVEDLYAGLAGSLYADHAARGLAVLGAADDSAPRRILLIACCGLDAAACLEGAWRSVVRVLGLEGANTGRG